MKRQFQKTLLMLAIFAGVPKAFAAVISGTVLFNGNPVAGVGVSAAISNANANASVDTGVNGGYSLNVTNGAWTVSVNCNSGSDSLESILGAGNFQCPNDVIIIVSNSGAVANFTVPPATNDDQIVGTVSDNNGIPVAGVNVYANNGAGVIYTNTTDSTGRYSFFVFDGGWLISVDCGQLDSLGYACVDSQELATCCGYTDYHNFTPQAGGNSGDFGYSVADGQVTIASYYGPGGAVTIPGTINALPVTGIGAGAFENTSVTAVAIPGTVTNIEASAFAGCGLASVIIPNSVTYVGETAFADCFNLTSVTLGTNVASIGDAAFGSCDSLAGITIPAGVTNIGNDPFVGCSSLRAINVDSNNPDYASVGGVLFDRNVTSLIQYPAGNSAATYSAPAGVTNIGEYAFFVCGSLAGVTIGSGVTAIGFESFAFCPHLTSLYFLGNAPVTDPSAFSGSNTNGYLNATIYYLAGTSGWTSPFQGLPAVMLSGQPGLPPLAITGGGVNVALSWPTNAAGLALQSSTNFLPPIGWMDVTSSPALIGGRSVVTLPVAGGQEFYRLKY